MCIVIDANKLAEFCDAAAQQDSGMRIIRQWIEGEGEFRKNPGRVIYSSEGDYADEMRDVPGKKALVERQFAIYREAGRARNIGKNKCDLAGKNLSAGPKSKDRHILALFIAGGATLLCTDDEALKKRFDHLRKKKILSGKIFPSGPERQRKILREHPCPD